MIRRVTLRRFKRFEEQVFELGDSVVLAGANNSGKSTLLQAISTWKFGLDRWREQRSSGSRARERSGVAVTRDRFTAVPLREMNLLWEQRRVTQEGTSLPRRIEIQLDGGEASNPWSCGMEFQYANPELLYVRPLGAKNMAREAFDSFPPEAAGALDVIHVPALSGIVRDEPRRDRGMQDLLVGMGRPGNILRNLLWEIASRESEDDWSSLTGHVRSMFGIDIRHPSYSPAQPHIVCEYSEPGRRRPLDLSNAGSGTLQVLVLLAFLYARRASVLLLDEPDAHQHVVLQKQVYERIRGAAKERRGQLIAATHSEVLLDATDPCDVIGFFSAGPRALASSQDRNRLREALRRLTTTELLRARECGAILYLEGRSDEELLRQWAEILDHRAKKFFGRANVQWLGGRNLKEARHHFDALRIEFPELPGICLLDGDNLDEPEEETRQQGLVVLRWTRYEIENYLLQPEAIKRYLGGPLPTLLEVDRDFRRQIPPDADLFSDIAALSRVKASDELLLPMLERVGRPEKKTDLHRLAAVMTPAEIHPEVCEKLDRIAAELLPPNR